MLNLDFSRDGYIMDYENEVDLLFEDEMNVYMCGEFGEMMMSKSMFMEYYYENEFELLNVEDLIDNSVYRFIII